MTESDGGSKILSLIVPPHNKEKMRQLLRGYDFKEMRVVVF
jgi:hypothetical protein